MTEEITQREERLYVAGAWRESEETIDVSDLADGGTFATVTAASETQTETALEAAHDATGAMRQTTQVERAEWLDVIADALLERTAEISEAIVREAGKPITSARGSVEAAAERFRRAADEARSLSKNYGEYREGSTPGHEGWRAIVKPEPAGTVLCITPYNYPLLTPALQVAPALAAGNSVVLKPASKTPVSAALLTDVITSETDLPAGAFNFVPGRGNEIGDVLASSEHVDTIAMTGSSGAGKSVARDSGIVTLQMELGGNAPAIVFSDANLETVVEACTNGAFKYSGQRCSAISRVIAHESVHDDVVSRLDQTMDRWVTGDLFAEETTFGPLISEAQAEWVQALITDAISLGAELIRGGDRDGTYVQPTLLANVPREARIVREEQFGPVAAVTTFRKEQEALDVANCGNLALDAAVFTSDHDRAMRVAERVNAGGVRINGPPSHGLGDIPYGGNDDSGIGREGIDASIKAMIRKKSIIL